MKQKKVGKRFGLNKKTVANLNNNQLNDVKGGVYQNCTCTCDTCKTDCD